MKDTNMWPIINTTCFLCTHGLDNKQKRPKWGVYLQILLLFTLASLAQAILFFSIKIYLAG